MTGWLLVAGPSAGAVRNVTTGQPPEAGILGDDAVSFGSGLLAW